jgi:regulation of enolase protein 1 (concanavalin A-like superfamily)
VNWYHEPPCWQADGDILVVTTAPKTDVWRAPDGTVIADNAHFRAQPISGDFEAQVKLIGDFHDLYDQAGLMLRLDEANWIKCGIELYDGAPQVSAVVTRSFSDWGLAPLPAKTGALWLRLKRRGADIQVHYSLDGTNHLLLRHAYFPPAAEVLIGLMAASPTGAGFEVRFDRFSLT